MVIYHIFITLTIDIGTSFSEAVGIIPTNTCQEKRQPEWSEMSESFNYIHPWKKE